ncbi:PREDICTED: uncharacterized protein LOC106817603 [Paramuricea clavata]|uniref:PREDICTED: uncharacterized protein LOC106817603 n=1 Tax=Paramuricea clavata TaxID=317549 RepID=A0A6S7HCP0_PARCT|nr:PREDICTED: uncharacterized protein LOC106817603 [Paramuricea clavata]
MYVRWFQGPAFLKLPNSEWPSESVETIQNDPERKKPKILGSFNPDIPCIDPKNFSNWQRLVRITAYCKRFGHNARVSAQDKLELKSGPLQPSEINDAKEFWILKVQSTLIDWKDRYKDLTPFVENDIIRVGGRLKRASLPYDQAHPILLPGNHHISKLIMEEFHEKVCHAGCERTLSESRHEYWIMSGRRIVKKIIKNCLVCRKFRQRPHMADHLMADLPQERVKPFSPPFTVTGVDFFGPFNLKVSRNKSVKAWGAIFTCATVRAIHLEIVESTSAEAFLHALRRFASHHGWPSTIISDNGTSFVGAERLLRELKSLFDSVNQSVPTTLLAELMYGKPYPTMFPIECYTDCNSLYESLKSVKSVSEKRLRLNISSIKELIEAKQITSVNWCSTNRQLADSLTMKGASPKVLRNALQTGILFA